MEIKKHLIYGLIDSTTDEIRYVGRSSSGLKRPRRHWREVAEYSSDTHCARWVRGLVEISQKPPKIWILEQFELVEDINDVLNKAEIFWIDYFKSLGAPLTNLTCGGEGWLNPSKEVTEKRVSKIRGRKHTEDARKKMSAALTGKKFSEERCQRMSEQQKGKKLSEETKKKLSQANKGKKRSEQARANISAGKKREEVL